MLRRLPALLALLVVAALSRAQFPSGMDLPTVEYNPLLLMNAKVQKELRMSPSMGAKVQNAFMQEAMKLAPLAMGGSPRGTKPLTPVQRKKALYQGITRMQANLAAMLTPPQRVRLRQLTLQSIGAQAVLQPKVAAALGLSPAQKTKLEERLAEANAKVADDLQHNSTPQTMQKRLGDMAKLQAEANVAGARILATTLTPTQRAKWQAMLGKPFNLTGFLGVGNLGAALGGG